MTTGLVVGIVAGSLIVMASALVVVRVIVTSVRRKQMAKLLASFEPGSVVRTSAVVGGSVRYRNYRARGVYRGLGIQATRAGLVLTSSELVVVGGHSQRIAVHDLGKYVATTKDGKLVLATDHPPGATGHLELHLRLPDADEWANALRQAGARTS